MCNGLNCCPNHQFAKFSYIVKRYFNFFKGRNNFIENNKKSWGKGTKNQKHEDIKTS